MINNRKLINIIFIKIIDNDQFNTINYNFMKLYPNLRFKNNFTLNRLLITIILLLLIMMVLNIL